MPARVEKVERPADDVAILYLKLPTGERLQFLAGQYLDILMKDGKRRSFSMANAPHDDQFLELHIRKSPGGAFSRYVFDEMKERAIIRFEGPLGTFYLREESDKPLIFVAGGTGSSIKALVEHAFHKGFDQPMVILGARARKDLYYWTCPAVAAGPLQLLVHSGVVRPAARGQLAGPHGIVHQAAPTISPTPEPGCVRRAGDDRRRVRDVRGGEGTARRRVLLRCVHAVGRSQEMTCR